MHHDTRELMKWAKARGWVVDLTQGGHLRFERPGCRTVFGSKTPGDWRAIHKIKSKLKAAERGQCVLPAAPSS